MNLKSSIKTNFISGASPWFTNAKASELLERLNQGHFIQNKRESDKEASDTKYPRINRTDLWGRLHFRVRQFNVSRVKQLVEDASLGPVKQSISDVDPAKQLNVDLDPVKQSISDVESAKQLNAVLENDIYTPRRGYDMHSVLHSLVYQLLYFDEYLGKYQKWLPLVTDLSALLVEHGALFDFPIAECKCHYPSTIDDVRDNKDIESVKGVKGNKDIEIVKMIKSNGDVMDVKSDRDVNSDKDIKDGDRDIKDKDRNGDVIDGDRDVKNDKSKGDVKSDRDVKDITDNDRDSDRDVKDNDRDDRDGDKDIKDNDGDVRDGDKDIKDSDGDVRDGLMIRPGQIYMCRLGGRTTPVRIECIYSLDDPRLDHKIRRNFLWRSVIGVYGCAIVSPLYSGAGSKGLLYLNKTLKLVSNDKLCDGFVIPRTLEELVKMDEINIDNGMAHLYPRYYHLKSHWKRALKNGFEKGQARRLQRSKTFTSYLIPILGSDIVLMIVETYVFLIPLFTRPEETSIRLSCCDNCRAKKL